MPMIQTAAAPVLTKPFFPLETDPRTPEQATLETRPVGRATYDSQRKVENFNVYLREPLTGVSTPQQALQAASTLADARHMSLAVVSAADGAFTVGVPTIYGNVVRTPGMADALSSYPASLERTTRLTSLAPEFVGLVGPKKIYTPDQDRSIEIDNRTFRTRTVDALASGLRGAADVANHAGRVGRIIEAAGPKVGHAVEGAITGAGSVIHTTLEGVTDGLDHLAHRVRG